MSIFGKLDAAQVPTNAFYIEAGDYEAEVTKAHFKEKDGQRQLVIEYTITNQDSQYLDQKAYHYYTLPDADMTAEMFELLPSDEKQKIRKTNSSIKRTLCGTDGNSKQRGLGVPEEDLNDDDWDPAVLVGTKIYMGIANFGKDGVNVRWVNLRD